MKLCRDCHRPGRSQIDEYCTECGSRLYDSSQRKSSLIDGWWVFISFVLFVIALALFNPRLGAVLAKAFAIWILWMIMVVNIPLAIFEVILGFVMVKYFNWKVWVYIVVCLAVECIFVFQQGMRIGFAFAPYPY